MFLLASLLSPSSIRLQCGKADRSPTRYSTLCAQSHFKVPVCCAFRLDDRLCAAIERRLESGEGNCLLVCYVIELHVLAGVMAILAVGAGTVNCMAGLIYRQKVVLIACLALNCPGHLGLSFLDSSRLRAGHSRRCEP